MISCRLSGAVRFVTSIFQGTLHNFSEVLSPIGPDDVTDSWGQIKDTPLRKGTVNEHWYITRCVSTTSSVLNKREEKPSHPTAFNPRGTPSPSRKRAMASYRWAPMSLSGILATDGSDTLVELKIANAWRWRSGDEGAVNWNTVREDG
jgi:hypothetical protein